MRKRKNIAPSTQSDETKMQTESAEVVWKQRWTAERRRRRGIFLASPRQWIFRLLGCSASCGLLFIVWSLLYIHIGPLRVLKGIGILESTHKPDLASFAKTDLDLSSHVNVIRNVDKNDLHTAEDTDPPVTQYTIESVHDIGKGISVESDQSGAQSIQAILADEVSSNLPIDLLPLEQPATTCISGDLPGDASVQQAGDAT